MAKIAAKRSAIANGMVRNVLVGLDHNRAIGCDDGRAEDGVMRGERADAQLAIVLGDVLKLGEPTDINEAPDPGWHYVLVSLRDSEPSLRSWRIRGGVIEEEQVVLEW